MNAVTNGMLAAYYSQTVVLAAEDIDDTVATAVALPTSSDADSDTVTVLGCGQFASLSVDVSAVTPTVDVTIQYRNHKDGAWIDLLSEQANVSAGSLYSDILRAAQIQILMKGTGNLTLSVCMK